MSKTNYTNEELFAALRGTEAERNGALRWIYKQDKWRNSVYKKTFDKGGDEEDAAEIFQTSIATFARKMMNNEFEGRSSLLTFFIGIVKNNLKKQLAKKSKIQFEPDQYFDQEEDSNETEIIKQERSAEQKTVLRHLMSQLKQKCQRILQMYSLGYSMEDIAAEEGFERKESAKTAAYKCRKELRELITGNNDIYQQIQQWV